MDGPHAQAGSGQGGSSVARPWRLRHKLLLGLGLMVGSVGLLVTGSTMGLTSYVGTMNTVDSKLAELLKLGDLQASLTGLKAAAGTPASNNTGTGIAAHPPIRDEHHQVHICLAKIRQAFQDYKTIFQDTVSRNRDPDPYNDAHLIDDIDATYTRLDKAIDDYTRTVVVVDTPTPLGLMEDPAVHKAWTKLSALVDELRAEVAKDMFDKIYHARVHYRHSIWTIGAATGLALLLVLTLMYLFRGWVFGPIRQLQEGVQRVFKGDFETPIDLKSGDELEELAAAFNATTRKLHEIYRDLERQVDERSRQLVRSERMVSVGFLAAGVAHEINNPLASIAFCSEALQSRLADYLRNHAQDAEVVAKYLRMIQQEAFRCKEITGKLLDYSRTGERRREPTDLSGIIQGVLEIAQHLQNCRGKRIVFQPLARVMAGVNAQDIKSVVLNLVVNALDSMGEGGILTITLRQDGPAAEMLFVDTGCGMTPEVLHNIFEPFYTRSRTGKGTGLGLFICHHIIEAHGGEIQAASAGPNQGSTFTVRIPIQATQAKEGPQSPVETALREADILSIARGGRKPAAVTQTEEGIGHAAA
jgi:two-component system NtrC family sensor kinase